MLEPTTLPTARPALPPMAERTLMASSGAEVPKATTVSPTTRSDTPQRLASADAPSVRALAPTRISASPETRNSRLSNMAIFSLLQR